MGRKFQITYTEETDDRGAYVLGTLDSGIKFYIDVEDFNKVSEHHWRFTDCGMRTTINGEYELLHRFIMNAIGTNRRVYPKDGNVLNCRKYNLEFRYKSYSSYFNGIHLGDYDTLHDANIAEQGAKAIFEAFNPTALTDLQLAYNEQMVELREAKRLLKAAVDNFSNMYDHIFDCDGMCDTCPIHGNRDTCDKWVHADEALELIGGSENE